MLMTNCLNGTMSTYPPPGELQYILKHTIHYLQLTFTSPLLQPLPHLNYRPYPSIYLRLYDDGFVITPNHSAAYTVLFRVANTTIYDQEEKAFETMRQCA